MCAETLEHVVFACPAYDSVRRHSGAFADAVPGDGRLFLFHRDQWSFRQHKDISEFLEDLWEFRAGRLGGLSRKGRADVEAEVAELWMRLGCQE